MTGSQNIAEAAGRAEHSEEREESLTVLDVIKQRRSIRQFLDRMIPEEALEALVEALRWAPSAGNLQSRKFYFVLQDALKRKLASAVGNPGLVPQMKKIIRIAAKQYHVLEAPLIIVACIDRSIMQRYGERGVQLYAVQDVAASIMNMMLVAQELGLGSVWLGAFNERMVAEVLALPASHRPVAIIPVGYPKHIPEPPPRKKAEEVVQVIS
jgi:nitroreductase